MRRMMILVCCWFFLLGGVTLTYAIIQDKVTLTEQELEYVHTNGTIRFVVDPDWYPYEKIDDRGKHIGISADLIELISERTGLKFEIISTTSWDESLEEAKDGKVDVVSFLNKTDERSKWLLFTESYFVDPNVFITREEHDYISNLARLTDETMVLPEGTSIEERLRKDYPNLKIVIVKSEREAISYVDSKKADMTLRSLTMAAYVIKNGGYFNLKIAGEIPNYSNYLKMGITKQNGLLQGILNKGIESITEQEIQNAINQHISIKVMKGFDYKLFGIIFSIFSIVLLIGLYWLNKIQHLNNRLKQRQDELIILGEQVANSEVKYRKIAEELELKNILLQETASTDALTGLRNRNFFNQRIREEIEKSNRYNSKLSLFVIDLDLFKRINDTYGHDAGDRVILYVTETLQRMIRKIDMLARWGGEEFVILLPEIGLDEAITIAEKLRHEAEILRHLDKETVTISIGVSTWTTSDTLESWFKRTDRALYHAKQQGRNRVCASEGPDEQLNKILVWDHSWESGHTEIDKQHNEILNYCNKLIYAVIQNDLRFLVLPELELIIQHIQKHFKYEEEVLIKFNYAGVLSHSQNHQQLIKKAKKLIEKSSNGNILPSDVIRLIVDDVVTMHLVQEDRKFFFLFRDSQ